MENVSVSARRIAHLKRTKWEFKFAKSVLAQLIAPIDREWQDIQDDNVYIVATRPYDFREYFQWLSGRTDNMIRMIRVAEKTMVFGFPRALTSTEDKHACPKKILESIHTIAQLYGESVNYEKSSLSIIPPDEFGKVHELQVGWSEPIRDAVHQLFGFLQQICDANPKRDTNLEFTLTFESPSNVDAYCAELVLCQLSFDG